MKVLVTGSRGQLARALADAAGAHGADVVTLGRPHLDLTRPRTVSDALAHEQPDIVINAAAVTHVDRAESNPEFAFAVNAAGAAAVARACDARGLPLIHLSTDYVFDGRKDAPFTETDAPSPLNAYGASKLAGERAVAQHCRTHLIVRTSWLYSAFGSNFVKTMLTLAASKVEIPVIDDQHGNPTSAHHLAEALLTIATRLLGDGTLRFAGIYHAAGEGTASWHAFAEEIFSCSRLIGGPHATVRPVSTLDYRTAAERPRTSALDCRKLHHTFGLKLPRWEAGVRHTVAHLLADRRAPARRARAEHAP